MSEGLDPQAELGRTAADLLAGTAAEPYLDPSPPGPLGSSGPVKATVAIDCELADAEPLLIGAAADDR